MKLERRESLQNHKNLFTEFFKMGIFTIGGGMAMLPLIQKVAVEDKRWLTEQEMIDCLAVSQSLPGVIAINSATYIGKRLCGMTGALAATLGVVMPSFLIIIAVVTLLGTIGQNPYLEGAFTGIKAAVCGLVLLSTWKLGKQVMKDPFCWITGITAFLAIGIFRITAVWAILAGAVAGILYVTIRAKRQEKKAQKTGQAGEPGNGDTTRRGSMESKAQQTGIAGKDGEPQKIASGSKAQGSAEAPAKQDQEVQP